MLLSIFSAAIVFYFSYVDQAMAGSYALSDSIVGPGFFEAFSFQTIKDPTNGTVFVFRCVVVFLPLLIPFYNHSIQ